MTTFLDKLNLRPGEQRLVVLVAAVLFVVFNLIFVWPYFGEFTVATRKLEKARTDLDNYQRKVNQTGLYKARLLEYEKDNPDVLPEDQAIQFQRTIQQQAAQSGVNVTTFSRATTKTNNTFFLEQVQTISVQTSETNLVDFLYNLGAGSSLIRVRELSLRPDQPRMSLGGNVTLVASYQKKVPIKGAAAAPRPEVTPPAVLPPPATPAKPTAAKPMPGAKTTATNAPVATLSLWAKVKGWFGSSSTGTATPASKAAGPAATRGKASPTNQAGSLPPRPAPGGPPRMPPTRTPPAPPTQP
jgi:hypothetical protein